MPHHRRTRHGRVPTKDGGIAFDNGLEVGGRAAHAPAARVKVEMPLGPAALNAEETEWRRRGEIGNVLSQSSMEDSPIQIMSQPAVFRTRRTTSVQAIMRQRRPPRLAKTNSAVVRTP